MLPVPYQPGVAASVSLALFDLDNTLIAGDSDFEWGKWLVHKNKVDGDYYRRTNEAFFHDYEAGVLDIYAYLEFALAPLAVIEPEELLALRREFMEQIIVPMWLPEAEALLEKHRQRGDMLLIISATNRFVVEPISTRLKVTELIATEPEMIGGRYTGKVSGTPSYKDGKVERLRDWLKGRDETLQGSYFYSDSINDLPLLELVEHPVAVDPDAELKAQAQARGWPVMSLRS